MTLGEVVLLVLLLVAIGGSVLTLLMVRRGGGSASEPHDLERIERSVRDEIGRNRDESAGSAQKLREEMRGVIKDSSDSMVKTLGEMAGVQKHQLEGFGERIGKLTESNEHKLEQVRLVVDERLRSVREENAKKLDEIRLTVDEKLQSTLEKRLGESFKLVSDRLEQVHKGLGEMQSLAQGVGDLKRVLTNVKSRGTWGEVQLESILEQIMAPDQYEKNVATKGGGERVEFAIRLPGPDDAADEVVWLPIDAKFPQEDYQRLVEASERGDEAAVSESVKALINRVKTSARDIQEKYISPPMTTDFAIMFLPTEGLYAEVLRRPGLVDELQRKHRVSVAGPTTLMALLNSLQMGFRTLAIQQRSSEVWSVLAAVKTEFGKFGEVLNKVKKKLDQASNTIEDAGVRTRAIERKLRDVESLPSAKSTEVLQMDAWDPQEPVEDGVGV